MLRILRDPEKGKRKKIRSSRARFQSTRLYIPSTRWEVGSHDDFRFGRPSRSHRVQIMYVQGGWLTRSGDFTHLVDGWQGESSKVTRIRETVPPQQCQPITGSKRNPQPSPPQARPRYHPKSPHPDRRSNGKSAHARQPKISITSSLETRDWYIPSPLPTQTAVLL